MKFFMQNNEFENEMVVETIYRRELPSPPAIEFASSYGKELFSDALQKGTMVGFFRLISHFQTQQEPAYCGLATLSMVLNSLSIDPRRKWKGVWRWFDESMLDCCEPLEKGRRKGITFAKVECLAHCAGAKVQSYRANQSTINDFRNHVIDCASSEDCHLIVSYHTSTFLQTGDGHFSPIGGYNSEKDMVLILDAARFKYPPHWVPLSLLWEAINTIDQATGHLRGYMIISRLEFPSLLYTVSCRHESWLKMAKYLVEDVREIMKSKNVHSIEALLSTFSEFLPANAGDFIKIIVEMMDQDENNSYSTNVEKERLSLKEDLLQEITETKLFKLVNEFVLSKNPNDDESSKINENLVINLTNELDDNITLGENNLTCCGLTIKCPNNHALTILLFSLPINTWNHIINQKLFDEMQDIISTKYMSDYLQQEVLHLRRQILLLNTCANEEPN